MCALHSTARHAACGWVAGQLIPTADDEAQTAYYHYDTEDHMVHKAWGTNAHSYYQYDADGKRVRIHPHNVTPTVFVYEGPDMLKLQMEKRDNGDTVAQYTIGARGALEAQRRGETSSVHHFDMLGSTLALTRPDEAVTDTYRYEAWGDILSSTGSTTNRHTWVGRERYAMSSNSDIALLGLRYYMPGIGRFTTLDPIRSGTNWFAYSLNPISWTDPTGELPYDPEDPPNRSECLKLTTAAFCFWCLYVVYISNEGQYQYSPKRACETANRECGAHTHCGACGPGPTPTYRGGCRPSAVEDFALWLRGSQDVEGACGGGQGSDKLGHCWAHGMLCTCGTNLIGPIISLIESISENDPEDRRANAAGVMCAQAEYRGRRTLLECCADETYYMSHW